MLKVGLTGGIGSGKSTAAVEFEKLGIPVFYADEESKKILVENERVKDSLKALLGDDIYTNDELNKELMASKVFQDSSLLNEVNQIVHPEVARAFEKWCLNQSAPYILKEAAILFEIGSYKQLDKNILVVASKEERIARVMKRSGWSRSEIEKRMDKQWADNKKIPLADFVIKNHDIRTLVDEIKKVHESLIRQSNSGG